MIVPVLIAALAVQQLVPAPAAGRVDGEVEGSQHAFVELRAARASFYEREVIPLTLRVGVEAEFAQNNLVQLFVQPLDFPVQVRAPWLAKPDGARLVRAPDATAARPTGSFTIAFGDDVTFAKRAGDEERNGAKFVVLELERSYVADRAGELVVPAPSVRFSFATRFEQDFFQERKPVDLQFAHAGGAPTTLRIQPLPEGGRPASFTGAVGQFSLRVQTDWHPIEIGESFKLELVIEGEGNTEFFDTPRLPKLSGIDVLGVIESKTATQRVVTYDLRARKYVDEFPALEFAYFDPREPAAYRIARTEPVVLHVLQPEPRGPPPIVGLNAGRGVVFLFLTFCAVVVLVVVAFVLALRWFVRRKRDDSRAG